MPYVTISTEGGIALVTIDNPPVNATSLHLRQALMPVLERVAHDPSITAMVLACAGRTFVAGADISEFSRPPQNPTLRELIAQLESISKPTVAALHGTALGGGFELAMACRYRVADKHAKIGMPEIKLGLLPGAGGTVRLPRLVGPHHALAIITSGDFIAAEKALEIGAIDKIADGDVAKVSMDFAGQMLNGELALPVSERDELIRDVDIEGFERQASAVLRKARGILAAEACVEAIRNCIQLPFDEALALEGSLSQRLRQSDQSSALRHLFFAEKDASRAYEIAAASRGPFETVGVIGAGTMGRGIAMSVANAGIDVVLVDASADAVGRALDSITQTYTRSLKNGSITEAQMAGRLASITATARFDALAQCDLVIEAVFEDMAIKKQVFRELDQIAKHDAILASNTSYLDVGQIAQETSRPQNLVGMHFFAPANVMKLIELVKHHQSDPQVIAAALRFAKLIGKIPVVVGVGHGFVGNRMLTARSSDAERLLLEGASPAQIDKVFTDFGWPMGPFQMYDLSGLDVSWRARQAQGRKSSVADALYELGRFGQKNGKGYYRYESGSNVPHPDPEVDAVIAKAASESGTNRRPIESTEIFERTHYPMINEGTKILEEGIARCAADIDVIWANGYGFPRTKGGPMYFADREGLAHIVERLDIWHAQNANPAFKVSELLRQKLASGARSISVD